MKPRSSALAAKEAFLSRYHAGQFAPGSKIPSELHMAQTLGISRETWRKALALLRQDGIVLSRHGSGTYVCEKPERIVNDLAQLQSMSKMIADAGITDCKTFSGFTICTAPKPVYEFFHGTEDTPFCLIQITRYTGEHVICASQLYLPVAYSDKLNPSDMPASIFGYLEKQYQIFAYRAFSELFIPSANNPLRQRLNLPQGCEAFGLRQQQYDGRGRPILYSFDCLRSDLFHFTILRTRP